LTLATARLEAAHCHASCKLVIRRVGGRFPGQLRSRAAASESALSTGRCASTKLSYLICREGSAFSCADSDAPLRLPQVRVTGSLTRRHTANRVQAGALNSQAGARSSNSTTQTPDGRLLLTPLSEITGSGSDSDDRDLPVLFCQRKGPLALAPRTHLQRI
jgi:hypothetical protein